MCNLTASGVTSTGVFAGDGGAFVLDFNTGNIWFCTGKSAPTAPVVTAPTQFPDYEGLAGGKTAIYGLVLAATNENLGGLYPCLGFTLASGCTGGTTSFFTLPQDFCTSQRAGGCFPFGLIIDKKLNVIYADPDNAEVVRCTYASGYQHCKVMESMQSLSGAQPGQLAKDPSGNIWGADYSCNASGRTECCSIP
jgi:hypothetical protein